MSAMDGESAPSPGNRTSPHTAGMLRLRAHLEEGDHGVPVTVWYPAAAPEKTRLEGIYNLSAAMDAPPVGRGRGIILFSHGSGGSDINHHDWAETLARAGFVVAAPRHIGDSHDAFQGPGSEEQLLERPRQLRAALDAVVKHPVLGPVVDPERVGALGFSAGGYTVLALLGARADFSRWNRYCERHPGSVVICPAGAKGIDVPSADTRDWRKAAEPRVKAAVLMAPFAMLYGDGALAGIDKPVLVFKAKNESITRNPANADRVAEWVPDCRTEVVEGDHYVFIAPVSEAVARKYPEYYVDAPGVDRTAIHRMIGDRLVEYFSRHLGAP